MRGWEERREINRMTGWENEEKEKGMVEQRGGGGGRGNPACYGRTARGCYVASSSSIIRITSLPCSSSTFAPPPLETYPLRHSRPAPSLTINGGDATNRPQAQLYAAGAEKRSGFRAKGVLVVFSASSPPDPVRPTQSVTDLTGTLGLCPRRRRAVFSVCSPGAGSGVPAPRRSGSALVRYSLFKSLISLFSQIYSWNKKQSEL